MSFESKDFTPFKSADFNFEPPEPMEYEDTYFKSMADDIKGEQNQLREQVNILIEENRKSDRFNSKIAIATLTVALLTLFATIAGIVVTVLI